MIAWRDAHLPEIMVCMESGDAWEKIFILWNFFKETALKAIHSAA